MIKKCFTWMGAGALALVMVAAPVYAQSANASKRAEERAEKKEKHPEIVAALENLQNAKFHLEHAAHDFGGHRAEAVKLINQAIEQLHQAQQYDKK